MTDIMLFVLSEDIDVTCKGARVSKRDRSIEAVDEDTGNRDKDAETRRNIK